MQTSLALHDRLQRTKDFGENVTNWLNSVDKDNYTREKLGEQIKIVKWVAKQSFDQGKSEIEFPMYYQCDFYVEQTAKRAYRATYLASFNDLSYLEMHWGKKNVTDEQRRDLLLAVICSKKINEQTLYNFMNNCFIKPEGNQWFTQSILLAFINNRNCGPGFFNAHFKEKAHEQNLRHQLK